MTTSRSTQLIFGLAFFGFIGAAVPAVVSATDAGSAARPTRRTSSTARIWSGRWAATTATRRWKMGPKGPEPDMSRALTGHPEDLDAARAAAAGRAVGRRARRDEHRVRRSVGRQLHREPDARQGNRPRRSGPRRCSSRRCAPAGTRARAARSCRRCRGSMIGQAHRRRPQGRVRVSAVAAAGEEPRAAPMDPTEEARTRQGRRQKAKGRRPKAEESWAAEGISPSPCWSR